MTAPSELAELILEWAEKRKPETFTTAQVYQDLNFIDTHKEESDSLRYMFKKGIIARKKKDSRSFEYALADVAPDDFEFFAPGVLRISVEPEWREDATEDIETVTSGYVKVEEIKESSPLDIEHFNAVYDANESNKLKSKEKPVFNIDDWSARKIFAEASPGDVTWSDTESALWRNEKLPEQADSIQIGGDHYKKLVIQPWDAMEAWMSKEQFIGFLRGNALKYIARCDDKGGVEDVRKARHYLDKLIETMEK